MTQTVFLKLVNRMLLGDLETLVKSVRDVGVLNDIEMENFINGDCKLQLQILKPYSIELGCGPKLTQLQYILMYLSEKCRKQEYDEMSMKRASQVAFTVLASPDSLAKGSTVEYVDNIMTANDYNIFYSWVESQSDRFKTLDRVEKATCEAGFKASWNMAQ